MKTTLRKDIFVDDFLTSFNEKDHLDMSYMIQTIEHLTSWKPNIWGNDIVGFGNMTYSNTYVKNQPFFKLGFRKSSTGYTLYLNAYDKALYQLADQHNIKHGMGCFYLKKKDIHSNIFKALILESIKH